MPLVTTKKMFEQSYRNGYAIGAFNVNDMEIIQGIVNAGVAQNAPLILQVSAGARKYADPVYQKAGRGGGRDLRSPHRTALRSRRLLRPVQKLHRKRIYFRHDRRFQIPFGREYPHHPRGSELRARSRRGRRSGTRQTRRH